MSVTHEQLTDVCKQLVKAHSLAASNFTEFQLAECIRQALLAGDFQQNVVRYPEEGMSATHIGYLPYHRMKALEQEIERLRNVLKSYKILE